MGLPDSDDALEYSMASLAAVISEPSRVKILCALMDGRAWTATELSVVADIAASTASAHLSRLVSEKLISCLSGVFFPVLRTALINKFNFNQ